MKITYTESYIYALTYNIYICIYYKHYVVTMIYMFY